MDQGLYVRVGRCIAASLHRVIDEAQAEQRDNANRRVARLIAALAGAEALDGENQAFYHALISGSL